MIFLYEKSIIYKSVLVLLFTLLIASCGTLEVGVDTPSVSEQPPPMKSTEQVVAPATEKPTAAPTETPEPSATPNRDADPLAGLVYSTSGGLWLVERDGESEFLIDQPKGALSPDGNQVAYASGEVADIWVANLLTGEQRNLTNTTDRVEDRPQWWPERPDVLVFGSSSADEPGIGYGQPTTVNLDGSGYQVLDAHKAGPEALAPDGETIAFGCCDGPGVLYHWSGGQDSFNPSEYGLNIEKLIIPAWSPDGRLLAWQVAGNLTSNTDWQIGFAIFDLVAKTSRLFHTYTSIGGGETPHYLTWSPGGEWIAFATFFENAELGRRPSLWVVRADGQEEYFLGVGYNPVWSPDGGQLAFNQESEDPNAPALLVVAAGNWGQPVQLPFRGAVIDWISR